MISGNFGDEDELFFEIELIAADGLQLPIEALFDTGFSWWLPYSTVKTYVKLARRAIKGESSV